MRGAAVGQIRPPALALLLAALLGPPAAAQAPLEACLAERADLAARLGALEAARGVEGLPPGESLAERVEQFGTRLFWKHCFLASCCVLLAALAAGLTMGMTSLEPMEMEIIVKTEEKDMLHERDRIKLKQDQAAAIRVLPLIKDHHRLLVTLLLMNSLANEALPLFLDQIVPSWLAVVLSVTLVLVFGEIIPSAVFTGTEQLRIAAFFARTVTLCRFLLTPLAWPIAKVLDCLLGKDHKGRYNFAELRAIVGIHARLGQEHEQQPVAFKSHDSEGLGIITTDVQHHFTEHAVVVFTGSKDTPAVSTKLRSDGTLYYVEPCSALRGRDRNHTFKLYTSEGRHPSDLITFKKGELTSGIFRLQERDELKIMHGVMTLTHMTAKDAMVPLSQAWMLEQSQCLNLEVLQEILDSGFSRVPVYSMTKHNVRGFILVKKLIVVSPQDEGGRGRCVSSIGLDRLVVVPPEIPMLDLLNKFQSDRCHLALITDSPELVLEAWNRDEEIPADVHMSGIIALEDIIERLLQEEIEDEHDAVRNEAMAAKRFATTSCLFSRPSTSVRGPFPKLQRRHTADPSPDTLRAPLLRALLP